MQPLTAKQIEKVLLKNGFHMTRQRGSHKIFWNEATKTRVPVPFHGGNKPLPRGTFHAIMKQSKIPRESFR